APSHALSAGHVSTLGLGNKDGKLLQIRRNSLAPAARRRRALRDGFQERRGSPPVHVPLGPARRESPTGGTPAPENAPSALAGAACKGNRHRLVISRKGS